MHENVKVQQRRLLLKEAKIPFSTLRIYRPGNWQNRKLAAAEKGKLQTP
jgi:hypothetical protein